MQNSLALRVLPPTHPYTAAIMSWNRGPGQDGGMSRREDAVVDETAGRENQEEACEEALAGARTNRSTSLPSSQSRSVDVTPRRASSPAHYDSQEPMFDTDGHSPPAAATSPAAAPVVEPAVPPVAPAEAQAEAAAPPDIDGKKFSRTYKMSFALTCLAHVEATHQPIKTQVNEWNTHMKPISVDTLARAKAMEQVQGQFL
jgi:hypothetical protein